MITSNRILLVSALLSLFSCGAVKKVFGDDPTTTPFGGGGQTFEFSTDPIDFWISVESSNCSPAKLNYQTTNYNINDVIISEYGCSFDGGTRIRKAYEKLANFSDVTKLEEYLYAETEYNAANRPVKYTSWTKSDKQNRTKQILITYDSSGSLTKAVETSGPEGAASRTVTTYTFGAGEDFVSKKIETFSANTVTRVEESNCYELYQVSTLRPCEETKDGVVQKKIEMEGADVVRKALVNGSLTEVVRYSVYSGFGNYGWDKVSLKAYKADGTLNVSGEYVCNGSGGTRDCSASAKNGSGIEICSSVEKQTKVATFTEVVGGKKIERVVTNTTSLTFSEKLANRDVSGTATLLTSPGLGDHDYAIRIDTKPATNENPLGDCSYFRDEDVAKKIWADNFTTGSLSYKSKSSSDSSSGARPDLIYEISGIPTNQINERTTIKSVTIR